MASNKTWIGTMGDRRLTGRVETRWPAAVLHVDSRRLWVADVVDVSVSGLCLMLDAPINVGDALEVSLRDPRGRQAQVTGTAAQAPKGFDHRLGVDLQRFDASFIDLVVHAFQADILAAQRPGRRVDFGLGDVQPEQKERKPIAAGEWQREEIADVIPRRRAVAMQGLLPDRKIST